MNRPRAKRLGAFYTPLPAVEFIVRWAIRAESDTVLDPGYGDGRFLKCAAAHLACPAEQVYGIEFDEDTFLAGRDDLKETYGIEHLLNEDFFRSDAFKDSSCPATDGRSFDAVVGNPPFIRFQVFKGERRRHALERVSVYGPDLPGHVSAWAPFLIQAVHRVKPGGRLAMVVPAELNHAAYARQVLGHLLDHFASLDIVTFRRRLFPELAEDTLIVLAEGKGRSTRHASLLEVERVEDLQHFAGDPDALGQTRPLAAGELESLRDNRARLLDFLIDKDVYELYRELKTEAEGAGRVRTLGSAADIHMGYVTGANTFFHPSQATIDAYEIPDAHLQICIRRSRRLKGLHLTEEDLRTGSEPSQRLLKIEPGTAMSELPAGLKAYLRVGRNQGLLQRFKVRQRKTWYSVPNVKIGHAFLTYMVSGSPRLVHNSFGVTAPNSLYVVTFKDEFLEAYDPAFLSVAWYTSLTFLSAELEGHSLGAGMLKLEPGEAKRLLVALPETVNREDVLSAYERMDRLLRTGDTEAALDLGDRLILQAGLGLSAAVCRSLREAYRSLRRRRVDRGRAQP